MTSSNAELFERARRVMPGGVSSPVRAFGAVGGTPRFAASARGAWITDVEGKQYVDLVGSWGPMILGHAHPEVVAAVQRTASVVQHKLEMSSIALEIEVGELPRVICDASQIQQVLTAIIINAADAINGAGANSSGNGKVKVRASVVEGGRMDIAVSNNGPPIPKDVLPKIFEPFFSTKQATSGVGLGLAVAYGIVKRHGGDIQVETGAETTFHVILPIGDSAQPSTGNLESADVRQAVNTDR